MLLTLQKLTFLSVKLQTLILSCLKSFGFYKLLELFLSGGSENCSSSLGRNRLFLFFSPKHMLRCPILDWINVNSMALYRAPVMHKASRPGSSPCDLDFFPPILPWKRFQVVFSLWFGFILHTFLLWQDSAPPRLFLFSQLPGTF